MLMFSALKNNDKVGLLTFCDDVLDYFPPRKGKANVLHLIRQLVAAEPVAAADESRGGAGLSQPRAEAPGGGVPAQRFPRARPRGRRWPWPTGGTIWWPSRSAIRASRSLPDVGFITLGDAETGEIVELDTRHPEVRRLFAEPGAETTRRDRATLLKKCGVDELAIRTDEDYLRACADSSTCGRGDFGEKRRGTADERRWTQMVWSGGSLAAGAHDGLRAGGENAAAGAVAERSRAGAGAADRPAPSRGSGDGGSAVACHCRESRPRRQSRGPEFGGRFGDFRVVDSRDEMPRVENHREILRWIYTLEPIAAGRASVWPVDVAYVDARPQGDGKRHIVSSKPLSVEASRLKWCFRQCWANAAMSVSWSAKWGGSARPTARIEGGGVVTWRSSRLPEDDRGSVNVSCRAREATETACPARPGPIGEGLRHRTRIIARPPAHSVRR